ncbi:hypothetical protein MHPYR_780005 [uncultured Mycobacterium sp.]|uniref:Uncharacterized protein n=1 Tax=uncultured Mycobacterium sp. TaxID=171292 RepID=A0A1Y5PL28_9MYCO|nr:hypothetical protein MHPYR_780005 [uncultured Mycobacterium sp.]
MLLLLTAYTVALSRPTWTLCGFFRPRTVVVTALVEASSTVRLSPPSSATHTDPEGAGSGDTVVVGVCGREMLFSLEQAASAAVITTTAVTATRRVLIEGSFRRYHSVLCHLDLAVTLYTGETTFGCHCGAAPSSTMHARSPPRRGFLSESLQNPHRFNVIRAHCWS